MNMDYDVEDFQRDVIERSRTVPVVVDFWAEWCGPCRVLGPVLERLAEKAGGAWILAKVDTEQFPQVAASYGIRSIPNVKLFVDGNPVNEFAGAIPEPRIVEWLRKSLPSRHAGSIEAARTLLRDLRFADASDLLRSVLADEPQNSDATALLAKALFFSDPDRALAMADAVEHGVDNHELAEAIRVFHGLKNDLTNGTLPDGSQQEVFAGACRNLLEGRFDEALESLIEVIRADRYYHDDAARRAGIAIFKFLGEDHPVTLARRRDFNRAVFS
jgi:putative thioredoxin